MDFVHPKQRSAILSIHLPFVEGSGRGAQGRAGRGSSPGRLNFHACGHGSQRDAVPRHGISKNSIQKLNFCSFFDFTRNKGMLSTGDAKMERHRVMSSVGQSDPLKVAIRLTIRVVYPYF